MNSNITGFRVVCVVFTDAKSVPNYTQESGDIPCYMIILL